MVDIYMCVCGCLYMCMYIYIFFFRFFSIIGYYTVYLSLCYTVGSCCLPIFFLSEEVLFFPSSFFLIFGYTGSSLLHTGFFLIVESGGYSCCGAQTLDAQASVVGAQGLISLALGS